ADCITAHRIAVDSARQAGSRPGQAWALHNLGWALASTADPEALSCLNEAAAIREDLGDLHGQAQAAIAMSEARYKIHGPQAAYDHALGCMDLLRKAGNPHVLA